MQFQSMLPGENIEIISDLRKAKKCTHENVRFLIRRKKLVNLPSNIKDVGHIKRVELDLSYNKTLDHFDTFKKLAELGNIYGLGLIKHEKGHLEENIGLLDKLEVLNLWSNGLKNLPSSFAKLKNLKVLNLRNNSLKNIPDYFKEFKKLKYLNLQFNRIKSLPDFIYDLTNLEELNIATCGLTTLSPRLSNLKNLKRLNIQKNSITKLPDCFGNLPLEEISFLPAKIIDIEQYISVLSKAKNLKKLDLSKLDLEELPSNIGLLQHLKALDISQNKLKSLPESFGKLKLEELTLNGNPLNIHQTLPILGKLTCFKNIRSYDFSNFNRESTLELPKSIGNCDFIESIDISNTADIIFPDEISNCKSLKTLRITNTEIERLPRIIAKIPKLRTLTVHSNQNLNFIEDWVYEMHLLDKLNFQSNKVRLDLNKAKNLKGLRTWHIEKFTKAEFEATVVMPSLTQITFSNNPEPFTMPDVFFENRNLEKLNLYPFKQLNTKDFITKLARLKSLKELYFPHSQLIDINQLAKVIEQLPNLEKLFCKSNTIIENASMKAFRRLKEFSLVININGKIVNSLPPDYINFPPGILKLNNYSNYAEKLDIINAEIRDNVKEEYWELALMIKLKSYDILNNKYPSPFLNKGSINGKTIYVASPPSSGTLTELRNKLAERGAKIEKKLTPNVTDIFLTPKLKEDFDFQIVGDYNYILEDHLKAVELEENTPYLLEESNEELIQQITNLIKSKEENQLPLVVELISGGGANKKLNSYLLAIHLFSNDLKIRKSARNLFRKYASSELQAHIKKYWKDSLKKQYEIDRLNALITHDEINLAAFILAWQMTRFHIQENNANNKILTHLNLRSFTFSKFAESFSDIDHLTHLNLKFKNPFSNKELFELIKNNALEYLNADFQFDRTPLDFLNIETIKELSLGQWGSNSKLDLSELDQVKSNLSYLSLVNVEIKNASRLTQFPNLIRINLSNCTLDSMEGLYELKSLKYLNIHDCNFPNKVISSKMESLQSLETLVIHNSEIEEIDLNFSNFPKLKEISLSKNNLTKIPDTFEKSINFERANFSGNKLTSLPMSLFKIQTERSWSTIRIDASKNNIVSIGTTNKQRSLLSKLFKKNRSTSQSYYKNISDLNLTHNQLETIPDLLLNMSINNLHLEDNPIKEIPDFTNSQISLVRIQSEVLDEIPRHIFGIDTQFRVSIKSKDTKLPDANSLQPFNNVHLSAYSLPSIEEKVSEILKKKTI